MMLLSAIMTVVAAAAPAAAISDAQLRALVGLGPLRLTIANDNLQARHREALRARVVARFQEAGIPIVPPAEASEARRRHVPEVYIELTVRKMPLISVHYYACLVALRQEASLARDGELKTEVMTWNRFASGWFPELIGGRAENDAELLLRYNLRDIVDKLIEDIISVNPR